jgi:HEAT repeat protein
MSTLSLLLGLGMLSAAGDTSAEDPALLRELLLDRHHPRSQAQAALLLVRSPSKEAEEMVRQGLRQADAAEVFQALTAAIRLSRDQRFREELLEALAHGRAAFRADVVLTLAVLADDILVFRLRSLADDPHAELAARQAALAALGRSGRLTAVEGLIEHLAGSEEILRQAAQDALTELTGHDFGRDLARWQTWWDSRRNLAPDQWLAERLAYQAGRSRRLEADLERCKGQIVRLHQQLYGRLPTADRLGHVQTLVDHEDPTVRALAVAWSVELLPQADAVGQRALADLLLRLSLDHTLEVQKSAVLALGRLNDPRAFERAKSLLRRGQPAVRAAAAAALSQQALVHAGAASRQQVVPILQEALEDPSLEVLVAAAESLGTLGVAEAGPVLAALLGHPSEPARLTAAQALERVADSRILDGLLTALEDPSVTVRFSLVGAIGHAAGDGLSLTDAQRSRVLARLEETLLRDTDAGVRSRAATVLGQCGPPAELPFLYRRALSQEESRVQDKVWTAMTEIIARAGRAELLREWDLKLADARLGPRRLQLLTEVVQRWKKADGMQPQLLAATESLVQAQLDEGKWALAFPLVRELLARPGNDAEIDRRLRWLLVVAEQALREDNAPEALHAIREAQPFLNRRPHLAGAFEKLEKLIRP